MKYLPIIIITTFISGTLFAQTDNSTFVSNTQTTFGIKTGYNAIQFKIENENTESVQKEAGIYFGAFINIPTSDIFSIQSEILYSSSRYTFNDNINLIHVPISIQFKLANNFTGFFGPEIQFLLDIGNLDLNNFNNLMLGFNFGASYKISSNFSIEAKPYFSFSKLLDNGPGISRKLNILQIGLAYQF